MKHELTSLSFEILAVIAIMLPHGGEPEAPSKAIISTPNVTIKEGTKSVRIPITIDGAEDDQTIEAIALTVLVENPRDTSAIPPIVTPLTSEQQTEAFLGSLWTEHDFAIMRADQAGAATRYLAIPFGEPFGVIEADGLICTITVDTSQLKPGAYPINTAYAGRSSATTIRDANPEALWYQPIQLVHQGGVIQVVPKRKE